MPTFDDDARSVQDAQPAELYTITTPNTVYYLTSHDTDVLFGSQVYSASTISRDNAAIAQSSNPKPLTLSVALNHPLAVELLGGVPQRDVRVQIAVYMFRSGAVRQLWDGHVIDVAANGINLKLNVPSKLDDYFSVQLPIVENMAQCQHALYDAGCTLQRSLFVVNTTVASVSGTTIGLASVGGNPDNWSQYGELVRVADGERRTVTAQVSGVVTADVAFRTLNVGDAVQLFAGCDHTVQTCRDKFNNVVNFGGNPILKRVNVMSPMGYGVATNAGV